jgi:hypothetical protein
LPDAAAGPLQMDIRTAVTMRETGKRERERERKKRERERERENGKKVYPK